MPKPFPPPPTTAQIVAAMNARDYATNNRTTGAFNPMTATDRHEVTTNRPTPQELVTMLRLAARRIDALNKGKNVREAFSDLNFANNDLRKAADALEAAALAVPGEPPTEAELEATVDRIHDQLHARDWEINPPRDADGSQDTTHSRALIRRILRASHGQEGAV